MTIDKEQLIELLVEKTSMSEEEIETQLDQLIERILDAAKRGKALEIKEFGVFYFDEEGKLRFDPADELSTEISFKYAGMKPVELKPERDTSISDDEDVDIKEKAEAEEDIDEAENEDDEDPFATSFEDPVFDEPEEFEEGPEKVEESKEDDAPPFDFDDEKDSGGEETDEDFITDPFSSETLEPLEEPAEEEEKRTKIEDIKPASREPVKRKDNTGVFILIAIVVLAVLIGGYFYYIGTQSQSPAETTQSSTTEMESGANGNEDTEAMDSTEPQTGGRETGSNQDMAAGSQGSAEQEGSNQGTDNELLSGAGDSATETDQPIYGLDGTVIEEANDGYSIVVHSFRNENNAQETAEQLRADGYRVMISSRTVYENQVWRVSVGQFETLGNAQQATTELPAPYNTQNFIQRIRIN